MPPHEHPLAERYMIIAHAALTRAYEEYLAQIVAAEHAVMLERLPDDAGLIALAAWHTVFAKVARSWAGAMRQWKQSVPLDHEVQGKPVARGAWIRRVNELAALYRLGEMGSR